MFLFGIIAASTIAGMVGSLGLELAQAQMADNATSGNMTMNTGNMTGGNMTMDMGNSTDASGSISGVEDPNF